MCGYKFKNYKGIIFNPSREQNLHLRALSKFLENKNNFFNELIKILISLLLGSKNKNILGNKKKSCTITITKGYIKKKKRG